jgi:hypothetical protein
MACSSFTQCNAASDVVVKLNATKTFSERSPRAHAVNGAASRLVAPRFLVPAGASAVSNLALVTRVFDPGSVIAAFRGVLVLLLAAGMVALGDVPEGGVWALPRSPRRCPT